MSIEVRGLFYYPVKSCAGTPLRSATLGPRGITGDRSYVVVSAEGRFLTQREKPRLALVSPRLDDDGLRLAAPEMSMLDVPVATRALQDIVVWGDTVQATDQGDLAAEWLSEFLATPCRLMRIANDASRLSWDIRGEKSTYRMAFADAYPVLMTSEESLADLNARLTLPVPMNRFRPNVVVRGAPAFAEDGWQRLRLGDVEATVAGACIRCVIISVNQDTAKRGVEPLRTLATFRRDDEGGVAFGQNLVYRLGGTVSVGDGVEVVA